MVRTGTGGTHTRNLVLLHNRDTRIAGNLLSRRLGCCHRESPNGSFPHLVDRGTASTNKILRDYGYGSGRGRLQHHYVTVRYIGALQPDDAVPCVRLTADTERDCSESESLHLV